MNLRGNRFNPFPQGPRVRLSRVAIYTALIVLGAGLVSLLNSGRLKPLYSATPTPTRPAASHLAEGQAFFDAGQLDEAIAAYQRALALAPSNAELWIELARIQTYSSDLVTTDADRTARLGDALESITTGLELEPENPTGYAIKALVLDWSADPGLVGAERSEVLLNEAAQAAVKALQLEPNNPLALAFQAEVLADQLNWSQALDVGEQAATLAPNVMDVHRAYAKVLESSGDYTAAIDSYQRAIALNPNLPFLYLSMGANYRYRPKPLDDPNAMQRDIDLALEAYSMAANLNPRNPLPYLSIASTYANQGEFFIAERNAQKALTLDPANADIYGRLGVLYYRARNYEGSLPVLRCAVRGCTSAENEEGHRLAGDDLVLDIAALPLSASTLNYYYTYGSALAYFGSCAEARTIFAELRASAWMDSDVEGIIQVGEQVCAGASAEPSATPAP
jgi:tetratricopeptide (TPR) repeat protein